MKKITKIEDMLTEIKSGYEMGKDYSYGGNMLSDKDLFVLPADDPIRGIFGCIVFEKENDSNSMVYASNVYDDCKKIMCDTGDDFFDELKNSLKSNYPTFMCNNPEKLRIGFISLRNDENLHFSLGIKGWKEYIDKLKETK